MVLLVLSVLFFSFDVVLTANTKLKLTVSILYYTIPASNGSLISVYCDMEGQCDGKGGWMRVGYINMNEPGNNCPNELKSYNFENTCEYD